MSSILRRIQAASGQDLAAALLALPPRDLRSLLLHVMGARAGGVEPATALSEYRRLRAARPSYGDARVLHRFEGHALAAAAAFEALELSPVAPLGASRALGGTHPNNLVTTIRALEIAGDPTTGLALEAALRRHGRADRATPLRLCAVARVMRMQPAPPPYLPHFKLFAAATATRQEGVLEAVREHLGVQLELVARLRADGFQITSCVAELSDPVSVTALLRRAGLDPRDVRGKVSALLRNSDAFLREHGITLPRGAPAELDLSALPPRVRARAALLDTQVLQPLATRYPFADMRLDLGRLEGLGYYSGPTLRLTLGNPAGESFAVADGGVLDWTARLLGDGGERLVTSGMGVEIVCARF